MAEKVWTTPGQHFWTVPENVSELVVEVWGGDGGDGEGSSTGDEYQNGEVGGYGGYAKTTVSVNSGDEIEIWVGADGEDGSGYGSGEIPDTGGDGGIGFRDGDDAQDGVTTTFEGSTGTGGGGGGAGGETAIGFPPLEDPDEFQYYWEENAFCLGGGAGGGGGGRYLVAYNFPDGNEYGYGGNGGYAPSGIVSGWVDEDVGGAGGSGGAFNEIYSTPGNDGLGAVSRGTNTSTVTGATDDSQKVKVKYTRPPKQPQNFSATIGEGVTLNWTHDDSVDAENGFRIYRSVNSSPTFPNDYTQIATLGEDITTHTDTSYPEGSAYYAVTAFNEAGESPPTSKSFQTVISPSLPQNFAFTNTTTQNQLSFTWDAVNWGNDQGDYQIYRAEASGTTRSDYSPIATVSAGETSYTDTNLEDGERYFYRIGATNSAGDSGLSNEIDARVRKVLTRSATVTGDGTTAAARGGIVKTRITTVAGDGQISVTRSTSKPRTAVMTGDGFVTNTRAVTKSRTATATGSGQLNVRAEFREVFPDEQTNDISWDFSFDDPFGFVSEWIPEETLYGDDSDAFTVVVDSYIDETYELGVEYDEDGDGIAEHRTATQTVNRDGQTLVFSSLGESGQYRLYIQKMRPRDHLRAVTVAPTRY